MYSNLIDYFISYKMKNLGGLLRGYQRYGEDFIQKIVDEKESLSKTQLHQSNISTIAQKGCEKLEFVNVALEVLDRVPVVDRCYLPISEVVEILPSQLFKKKEISLHIAEVVEQIPPVFNKSSIYLPSCNKYVFLTGVVFFENLFDIISAREETETTGDFFNIKKTNSEYARKVWIPKVLLFVSKSPVYGEMEKRVKSVLSRINNNTGAPIENLIKTLVFELPNKADGMKSIFNIVK